MTKTPQKASKRATSLEELNAMLLKVPEKKKTFADMTGKEIIHDLRGTIETLRTEKNLTDEEILDYINSYSGRELSLNTLKSYMQTSAVPKKRTRLTKPAEASTTPKKHHVTKVRGRDSKPGTVQSRPKRSKAASQKSTPAPRSA